MAFDPVPWAISGSELDAYVMRGLANVATRDTQGIQLPGNAKVTPTASPSGQVQIAPGGLIIRNKQAAGQTYIGYIPSATTIPVAPTGGVGRSDLVIATVKDPDFAPWQPYTDPNQILFGPYFYPEVISGVGNTTTSATSVVPYSAVELARIDIPPNTTGITAAMIKDLRTLAQPRYKPEYDVQQVPTTVYMHGDDTTFQPWPTNTLVRRVPSWATHAQVIATINGIKSNADATIQMKLMLSGISGAVSVFDFVKPAFANDYVSQSFMLFGEFDVRALRDTDATVAFSAKRTDGGTNIVAITDKDQIAFDLQFSERVV